MNHCGRDYAISIEEKIDRSLSLGFTPVDNMDGTYNFLNGPNNNERSFILNFCQVCGTACPRYKNKKTQSFKVFCSSKCRMYKMFSYEEYKKGEHKKKPPKGKYFCFNNIDLAIKYKNAIAYKEADDDLYFFVPYKGKKEHHTLRTNMLRWSKSICENCGKVYYVFCYQKRNELKKVNSGYGSRRYESCNYVCRGKVTLKNRYNCGGDLENPIGLYNGYPYFREFGEKIMCHRRVIELILGRKLEKDEHVHHIDMDKLNYSYDNLWLTDNSNHRKAHHSYNQICESLMNNYNKYSGVNFNSKLGEYYLTYR